MNITALAGGVGGAKLAEGLYRELDAAELTVIVNTGDDFQHYGLSICPDLDTVCYTLAGFANPSTGWGRVDESWKAIEEAARLGGPDWFSLGDHDLGTHLERTRRLKQGDPLSRITADFCATWGIGVGVLPMSDDPVPTIVETREMGPIPFQNYFVEYHCRPQVTGFRFEGVEAARPAPGVIEAIDQADAIVICPSNPWVSIGPILAIPDVREAITSRPVIAVSPIIGGKALKGPAAKMYAELGVRPSALAVARHYGSLLAGFVMDQVDAEFSDAVRQSGIIPLTTDTIMQTREDRSRLAREVLDFANLIVKGRHTDR